MKPKSKKRRETEKELLFYLELFSELKGREGAYDTLSFIETQIDKLVELLKQM